MRGASGSVGRGWTRLDAVGRGWTRLDAVGRGWTRLDAVCSVTDNSDSHRFLGSVGSVGTELRAPYSYSTPYIITKYEKLYGA